MPRYLDPIHNSQCACAVCTDNRLNPTTIAPVAIEFPPQPQAPQALAVVHQPACTCVDCTARKLQPEVSTAALAPEADAIIVEVDIPPDHPHDADIAPPPDHSSSESGANL